MAKKQINLIEEALTTQEESKLPPPRENEERDETDDQIDLTFIGEKIRTIKDALRYAKVDLNIWEVERCKINSWPTTMKLKRPRGDQPTQVMNWQVTVRLRRKAPKPIQEAIRGLLDEWPKGVIVKSARKSKGTREHVAVLGLHDAHFGKLCWGEESGHNYDTKLAAQAYSDCVADLLEKTRSFPLETIHLPVGSDFFQVDNWMNTTASGTAVEHDGRFQKVFTVGVKAISSAVEMCLAHSQTVNLMWVPGNHDLATSWYLMQVIAERFRDHASVTFDSGPKRRKCLVYGVNMIWVLHGEKEKFNDLPLIMATELRPLWSKHPCCEIHMGHKHKSKEMKFISSDEFGGIRVRTLPSISGTDRWHYDQGYIKNRRVSEVYLYNKTDGYAGHLSTGINLLEQ